MPSTESRFVGRRQELALIESALGSLGDGATSALQLTGETGIGKTRLLTEALDRAQKRDCLALAGRGVEFEGNLPFAIFIDALDEHLASLEPHFLESLASEQVRELASIFPALAWLTDERPSDLQAERHCAHQAVRALLEQLVDQQPLVLALDDLHWADVASIELLSHLVRYLREKPILFMLAFRPHEIPPQFASTLAKALHDRTSVRLELAPLSISEAGELLGKATHDTCLESMYSQSGGNPFYLEQLARASSSGRDTTASPDGAARGHDVPETVAAAITAEISALPDDVRTVAQAAAVAGDPFEPGLTADTAGISNEEALTALDRLLDADIIRPLDVPCQFRFRHPIVHRAVYESSGAGWRLMAHERVAAALEQRGAPATARAHHIERSAHPGDEAAIALLTQAGHMNASRAPAAAANSLAAALRLLPADGEATQQRVELLLPMGIALGSVGRLTEARQALIEALDLLPPDAVSLRVQAVLFNTMMDLALGDVDQAQERLLKLLAELDDQRSPDAAVLRNVLAMTCFVKHDFEGMQSWASDALEDLADDGAARAVTLGALASAAYSLDDVPRCHAYVADAVELVDRLPDDEVAQRPAIFFWLGWSEVLIERFDDAVRHLERGIAVGRARGHEHWFAQMMFEEAFALIWQGRLEQSLELIEPAIDSALLSANNLILAPGLGLHCWVETMAGNSTEAIRFGERAIAAGKEANSPMFQRFAECFLAEAWLEAGEPKRCRDLLLSSGSADLQPTPIYKTRWYHVLAQAEVALGNVDAADVWATRAEKSADRLDLNLPLTEAQRARATVALARGDAAAATDAALASVSAAVAAGAPIEAARSRVLAGTALATLGERKQATAELEQAESELADCGAFAYRNHAARELRRLGRRARQRTDGTCETTGIQALTSRELQIAELVSAGKRNREIAAQLFISVKTVELHLSQAFAKLEVSSRVEVATMIERERSQASA